MKRGSRGAALVAAAALAASCGGSGPPASTATQRLTVVVVVVDSLMPHEITASTPNLNALKAAGTFYDESRSVYAAETIPNHVAMMTGVYPDRSGIPTNDFIDDFASGEAVKLSIPERLTANTLFTWIEQACGLGSRRVRTGATLSKTYLFDVFGGDALNAARANDNPRVFNSAPQSNWDPSSDPAYIPSPDQHTPDLNTMTQALAQLPDVDFFFVNLGDVDRTAHASGPGPRATALTDTDTQVGRLVTALQDAGRWDSTVMFLVSDHAMDFSDVGPGTVITTQAMLDTLGTCVEPMIAVPSGATESISVLDRSASLVDRQAALRAARSCLLGNGCACGATQPVNANLIAGAWYIVPDVADASGTMPANVRSAHRNFGDMSVFAATTGKFGDPPASDGYVGGLIPGNHGSPVTLHNTFLVTGGSPWIKAQVVASSVASPGALDRLPEQSENIDIAPTVAWLLGLGIADEDFPDYPERTGGFDGRVLKEAFTQFDGGGAVPSPTACGRF